MAERPEQAQSACHRPRKLHGTSDTQKDQSFSLYLCEIPQGHNMWMETEWVLGSGLEASVLIYMDREPREIKEKEGSLETAI